MRFGPQPGSSATPQIFSQPIPDGDAGVAQTIRWMNALVNGPEGVGSWEVRQAALEAVRGVERGMHEIDALFQYVKDGIEFRGEHGETLQTPRITLAAGAGDCDDQSMLAAAMASSLGYKWRFRTVALRGSAQEYSHVYAEIQDKQSGQWVPMDTTVAAAYPGWEPDDVERSATYGTMTPVSSGNGVAKALALAALGFFL